MLIHIIGPGASGKSTLGAALADKINFDFIDLDYEYPENEINSDIQDRGYEYYVYRNIENYLNLKLTNCNTVLATSSGFMTYDSTIHPEIKTIHESILSEKTTILVLPSFDREVCISEITKRQMERVFNSNSRSEHRQKIIERFNIYRNMGHVKVATDKPINMVLRCIISELQLLTSSCTGQNTRCVRILPVS